MNILRRFQFFLMDFLQNFFVAKVFENHKNSRITKRKCSNLRCLYFCLIRWKWLNCERFEVSETIGEDLFSTIFIIWEENHPLKANVFLLLLANWQCAMWKCPMFKKPDRDSFSTQNCSKFAVECNWDSKFSQNERNLGLFWKKKWVFLQKNLNFSKSLKLANLRWNAYVFFSTWNEDFSAEIRKI